MTDWTIETATAHAVINQTESRAEALTTEGVQLRDAVTGAQGASMSPLIGTALDDTYELYTGLLVSNAAKRAENACGAVRQVIAAYQEADLQMAADAQQRAGQI